MSQTLHRSPIMSTHSTTTNTTTNLEESSHFRDAWSYCMIWCYICILLLLAILLPINFEMWRIVPGINAKIVHLDLSIGKIESVLSLRDDDIFNSTIILNDIAREGLIWFMGISFSMFTISSSIITACLYHMWKTTVRDVIPKINQIQQELASINNVEV